MEQRPYLSASDADLVLQARAGDGTAFAALVDRHRPLVISTTRKALRCYDDAEDAAQEAFVLACSRLDDLHDPSKFPTWLYSIAVNVVRKWLRHRALRDRGLRRFAADTGRPGASDQLGSGLSQEVLSAAVASLEVGDREVITLYYLVGLEQSTIAEILEVPVGTVKSRTHRARAHLKRKLLSMTQMHEVPEDFGRISISGFKGQIPWRKLLGQAFEGWETVDGQDFPGWERTTNTLVGRDPARPLLTGDAGWIDYELSLLITPISGRNPQVRFRISETYQDFYVLEFLLDWGAIAIGKVDGNGLTWLSVVDFPPGRNQEYHVMLAAREASLTSYVDGDLMNQVTDFSYRSGPVALWLPEGMVAFRDPRVRFMH